MAQGTFLKRLPHCHPDGLPAPASTRRDVSWEEVPPEITKLTKIRLNIMQRKVTVLLADDHRVVRQGLRALVAGEPDFEVVGEADNGREAVLMAKKLLPDVVVMDIAMPLLNGLEATRQILRQLPATKVLVLSSYGDYVQPLTQAGAAGYLIKQTAASELLNAIREVRKGNAFFSPSIARRLRDQCRGSLGGNGSPADAATEVQLTSRESEVLQLIAEGQPNKQIADGLGISVKTVEKHRQTLMAKLNIHCIADLTRYAISKGIVECNTAVKPVLAVEA